MLILIALIAEAKCPEVTYTKELVLVEISDPASPLAGDGTMQMWFGWRGVNEIAIEIGSTHLRSQNIQ